MTNNCKIEREMGDYGNHQVSWREAKTIEDSILVTENRKIGRVTKMAVGY